MKRTPLLILGSLFLILCIACLFNPEHSSNLHFALIIELVFFVQFAMTKKARAIPEPENITVSNTSMEENVEQFEMETGIGAIQEAH
jgi:hypothetical protein